MKQQKKFGLIILVLLFVFGCQSVVQLDLDDNRPLLVINSVLEAGCDSILIQVATTKSLNDRSGWKPVGQAVVRLSENGQQIREDSFPALSICVFYGKVLPGSYYRIEIETPDYGLVWGETQVPTGIEDGKMDIQFVNENWGFYQVSCRWQDTREERNFYWFGAARSHTMPGMPSNVDDTTRLFNASLLYSNSSLIDPFNRISDEGSTTISTCFEYYIRVEDSGLNGKPFDLTFLATGKSQKFSAFLYSMDKNYDAYLKSSIMNKENQDLIESLPLFYQPAYTHSNVHGGVGLVASFVRFERNLVQNE